MQFFPKLAEFIDRDTFTQNIEATLVGMMIDPVFTIREQSAVALIQLSKNLFDQVWLERVIEPKLEELARHERFMLRIQTIHLINQLKENVDAEFANRQFARHLCSLAEDPVPNIRFNVSKAIGGCYASFDVSNKQKARTALEKMASEDTDFDSKFYAQKTLEEIASRV